MTSDANHGNAPTHALRKVPQLSVEAAQWQTPTTNDAKNDNPPSQSERNSPPLNVEAANWPPTPKANDVSPRGAGNRQNPKAGNACLAWDAANWPTPRTITGGAESTERKQELGRTDSGGGDLQTVVLCFSPPAHATTDGPTFSQDGPTSRPPSKRRLNPAFAAWLMGWHPLWTNASTNFAPSETGWCHYKRQLRSCCFGGLSTMLE
jgi:hypothetical protein